MSALPIERLKALVELRDGRLYWLPRPQCQFGFASAGKPVALRNHKHGYHFFTVFDGGRRYYLTAHRCIWALAHGEWPEYGIDHINGEPADNRIENLRDVPQAVNLRNRRLNRNNRSGIHGVSFVKSSQKWRATISVDRKVVVLGEFAAFSDAASARRTAEVEHGYTFLDRKAAA